VHAAGRHGVTRQVQAAAEATAQFLRGAQGETARRRHHAWRAAH